MQFGSDPQIEIDVERVVMGNERFCRGAPGYRVQHRRLDFEIAARDEAAAHRSDDPAPPAQRLAALRVHDQVEIALAIAQLDIGQAVVLLWQRPQGLGENRERGRIDGQLAARRPADQTLRRRSDRRCRAGAATASASEPSRSRWQKIWILPEASCRSMNMPLLRIARMRPATRTRSSFSAPAASPA